MKKIILLFIFFFWTSVYCQTPAITINLSSNPSADTSVWGTGSNIFNIIVAGPHMDMLVESTVLVNIKSNGSIRCGGDTPNSAQPSNIVNGAAKSWIGPGAAGLLGEDCVLVPGTYELCVQFYGFKNATGQVVLLEKCVPFIIQGKNEAVCSPPININPANDKVFAARDLMSVMTFNWSPIISANHGLVTYRLLVWEVEEDQTNSVAIYNNQPFIDQEIKGQTSYNSLPGVFQKRKATYVWRVMAMDVEGKPICSKNQSEPTNFTTQAVASLANCLDFEGDYQTNVWSSFFVASIDIKNDSIHGNYMQFADDSGGSIAVDYHDFGGNWITKSTDGCLCFDFMVDWNADPSINTLARRGPSIVIFGGPQITYTGGVYNIASTPRAWPVWNNSMPFLVDGKWDKYCMPIALSSGGQLPSNAYMQWQIVDSTGILTGAAACAAWDTLIQNVTAMYIPTDYNDQPSELVNFDNFCWSCDSTVPPVEADCCSLATATGCLVIDQTKITVECGGVDAEGRQIYKVNNVIIKNTSTNVARTGLVSNSAGTNYVVAEPAGSFTITQLVPLSSNTISPGQEVHISFEAHLASGTSLSFVWFFSLS